MAHAGHFQLSVVSHICSKISLHRDRPMRIRVTRAREM